MHTCNTSTWERKAERLQLQGQPDNLVKISLKNKDEVRTNIFQIDFVIEHGLQEMPREVFQIRQNYTR